MNDSFILLLYLLGKLMDFPDDGLSDDKIVSFTKNEYGFLV